MKKKILCTICIRSGSKGVKKKNIKIINGKPLVYYSFITAKKTKIFSNIFVSSDSENFLNICKKFGVNDLVKRPKILSSDKSGKIEAIKHALISAEKKYNTEYDYVIDLDATSPLRTVDDIKKAYKKFLKSNSSNLFSVTNSNRSPYFNMVEIKNSKVQLVKKSKKQYLRRQDTPITYDLNASIYIWKRESLINNTKLIQNKTSIFVMPKSRSIDIDDTLDFKIVSQLLK
ncbi:acylneuraminate cytidylyltransferase family protein [Candidatus Pelagibacter sp.]|jgi:CMP-N,N'-diacetyllegionaminic acid synthase|nr:acylneuraminate cytidylyltransferase family protein [Candidatus Pelagibacter sp.]|tara:strand:- start:3223 stop:3912 length:690 start_codon:yes stop_codon:yes gene_type:complete